MVGSSKNAISGSSTFNNACRRETISIAFSESPPRSKKLSVAPMLSISRTSVQTCTTAACAADATLAELLLSAAPGASSCRTPLLTIVSSPSRLLFTVHLTNHRLAFLFSASCEALIINFSSDRARQAVHGFHVSCAFGQPESLGEHCGDRRHIFITGLNRHRQQIIASKARRWKPKTSLDDLLDLIQIESLSKHF